MFEKFKKKKEAKNDIATQQKDNTINTSGWDAITEAFKKIYPNQKEPLHYGTLVSWRLGGKDPLDGISIFDGGDYWDFLTYGFSELYDKEFENKEYSGYGFELTLKLKKSETMDDEQEIRNMCGVLQALGRLSYEKGEIFQPHEYIYTGQVTGMDLKGVSKITGFATILDEAGEIETPNGKVQFVQLIGMTDKELRQFVDKQCKVADMLVKLGNTLTDYSRESLV